jgi:hypothetical protein
MSIKAQLAASYSGWGCTDFILMSLTEKELLEGALQVGEVSSDFRFEGQELPKYVWQMGIAAPGSVEKKSYYLNGIRCYRRKCAPFSVVAWTSSFPIDLSIDLLNMPRWDTYPKFD